VQVVGTEALREKPVFREINSRGYILFATTVYITKRTVLNPLMTYQLNQPTK